MLFMLLLAFLLLLSFFLLLVSLMFPVSVVDISADVDFQDGTGVLAVATVILFAAGCAPAVAGFLLWMEPVLLLALLQFQVSLLLSCLRPGYWWRSCWF
jgi:hypothetical protein